MSASCEFNLNFQGTNDDFEKLVDKLYEIEGKTKSNNLIVQPFVIREHEITAFNGSCHNIWGDYYLQPDADMYLELAKIVPNAAFEVNSYRIYEGGGGGCETFLKVKYENRKLTFKCLPMVDDMSLPFIISDMYPDDDCTDLSFSISGKSKLFDSIEDLADYIESWDGIVTPSVTSKTNYLICNNPDSNTLKVKKAKELGVPIISEMKFVRMFGEIFDFEGDFKKIFSDITYEEFCEKFTTDNTITHDVFVKMLQNPEYEGLIYTPDGKVSLTGDWTELIYNLSDDGTFI